MDNTARQNQMILLKYIILLFFCQVTQCTVLIQIYCVVIKCSSIPNAVTLLCVGAVSLWMVHGLELVDISIKQTEERYHHIEFAPPLNALKM